MSEDPVEGRILGIDLGDVRIGLARSDLLGITAQPHGVLKCRSRDQAVREICRIVADEEIRRVVIGLPLLLSGEEGSRAELAREFAGELRKRLEGIEVILWDERLSTAQAERVMVSDNVRRNKRREKIDKVAAALILQSYLDAGGPMPSDRDGEAAP